MRMLIQLMRQIKKAVCSNKGEALMESIASVFILSILLVAVTAMIQTSLKMTDASIEKAEEEQGIFNDVIRSEYSASETAEIEFVLTSPDVNISVKHPVILNTGDDGIIAFTPEDEEP